METKRLIFRNRTRERIAEMLTLSKKKQLLFFGFETMEQLEAKLVRIEKGLANQMVDYRIFDLIEKQSNQVVGSCGFHHWIKDHSRSEIGYEIHKKFQNQGYMSEALGAVIRYGFDEMKLNRIEALIDPLNKQSIRIVEKFKFQKEGILREHYQESHSFEDSIMYSLLKSEF